MSAATEFRQGDSLWSLARKQLERLNSFSGTPSMFSAQVTVGGVTFSFINIPAGWWMSTPNATQSDLVSIGPWTGDAVAPLNQNQFYSIILSNTFAEAQNYYNNSGTVGNIHPLLILFNVDSGSSGYALSWQPPNDVAGQNQLNWFGNLFVPPNLYTGQPLDLSGSANMVRIGDNFPVFVPQILY